MKIRKTIITACIALIAYAANANAFNFVFLEGKGLGGELRCSDWNKPSTSSERASLMQWVFGFISGYDVATRPKSGDDPLNGEAIANFIGDLCKKNPEADLVSVAKYIGEYLEKEAKGEVEPLIILNQANATAQENVPDCPQKFVHAWMAFNDALSDAAMHNKPTPQMPPLPAKPCILRSQNGHRYICSQKEQGCGQ